MLAAAGTAARACRVDAGDLSLAFVACGA